MRGVTPFGSILTVTDQQYVHWVIKHDV